MIFFKRIVLKILDLAGISKTKQGDKGSKSDFKTPDRIDPENIPDDVGYSLSDRIARKERIMSHSSREGSNPKLY